MKANYSELFKTIVNAYYNDNFVIVMKELLKSPEFDKEQFKNVIASLCGVEVDFNSDNYINSLTNAISNYEAQHKIVNRVKPCSMDCADANGKTSCQKSCPFDAIFIDTANHTAKIDTDKCTDCGFCVDACPSGGILDKVEFIPLVNLLKSETPVIAAVAPAIVGQFGDTTSIDQMRSAFKKIGFTDMIEVAFFADMLTLKEAIEFDHHVKDKNDLMITSCCCPMWVGMLKRVYNDMVRYVSPSVSPMIAAGRVLKYLNPNCKVVFVGPCIAKKAEAKDKDLLGDIDFVLTFSELKDILDCLNIDPNTLDKDSSSEYASKGGRLYARTGGVSIAVKDAVERLFPEKYKLFKAIQANGVKECKEILSKAQNNQLDANFIEGMGCVGGCVGGPKAIIPKEKGTEFVNDFANSSEIKVSVDSDCMNEILHRLDINTVQDYKKEDKTKIFEREF